jgi:hypothetical protein
VASSAAGDALECEAELGVGMLRWWKNGNLIKECVVPQQMKGKTVFLSMLMYNVTCEVDFFI